MILLGLKFLLIFIIFYGLYRFLESNLSIEKAFIPVIVFSSIGAAVFLAGILNILLEAVILISAFSIIYLTKSVLKREIEIKLSLDNIFFILMAIFLALLLRGSSFSHYDDFSHWGIVAKEIVQNNQFPNFESNLITFQSYPTGSSSFIYFVAKILGDTEGVLLYAQSLLVLSGVTTLFAFVKKNYLFNLIIIFITYFMVMILNNTPFELLVDTLIPVLGLAGTVIIYYYGQKNETSLAVYSSLPITAFLMVIKNSSIFFVIINTILLTYFLVKNRKSTSKPVAKFATLLAVPYLMNLLWKKHVQLVFPNGLEGKHSLSISHYKSVLGDKTSEQVSEIVTLFRQRMTNFNNTDVQVISFIVFILISIIVYKIFSRKISIRHVKEIQLAAFLFSVYVLYQVALLGMYLLSMPINEALTLASYTRYSYTIVIYILGVLIMYLIKENQKTLHSTTKHSAIRSVVTLLIIGSPLFIADKQESLFNVVSLKDYSNEIRNRLSRFIGNFNIEEDAQYYIYISDENWLNSAGILYYIGRYELRSPNITIVNKETINNIEFKPESYLLIMESDETVSKVINDFNDQSIKIYTKDDEENI